MKFKREGIYRITIDEILDKNLARLLIASKKQGKKPSDLTDIDAWEKEESILFTNIQLEPSLSESDYTIWPTFLDDQGIDVKQQVEWEKLREGQVYILGRYFIEKLDETNKREKRIRIIAGQAPWDERRANRLHRFDLVPEMKTKLKTLYNNALLGRKHRE